MWGFSDFVFKILLLFERDKYKVKKSSLYSSRFVLIFGVEDSCHIHIVLCIFFFYYFPRVLGPNFPRPAYASEARYFAIPSLLSTLPFHTFSEGQLSNAVGTLFDPKLTTAVAIRSIANSVSNQAGSSMVPLEPFKPKTALRGKDAFKCLQGLSSKWLRAW